MRAPSRARSGLPCTPTRRSTGRTADAVNHGATTAPIGSAPLRTRAACARQQGGIPSHSESRSSAPSVSHRRRSSLARCWLTATQSSPRRHGAPGIPRSPGRSGASTRQSVARPRRAALRDSASSRAGGIATMAPIALPSATRKSASSPAMPAICSRRGRQRSRAASDTQARRQNRNWKMKPALCPLRWRRRNGKCLTSMCSIPGLTQSWPV